MQNTGKTPAETAAPTMPQYLVDRFENEWRQMRASAAETPKAATDKR
ncbi:MULTISPECIES: hypothetical protein [unclassified Rhizobium]|nr:MULTISPECIES: hypothetical protein [unclassified Rhizobium]